MKRKVIAITLTAMMAAGMLAGCGNSDSSSSLAADTTKEASTTEADGSTDGDSNAAGGDFSGQISVISREDGSGTRGADGGFEQIGNGLAKTGADPLQSAAYGSWKEQDGECDV